MSYLQIPEAWLERPVRVLLIGAGGTGSHLFGALMTLDHALRALGHPGGLHLTVYDPDRVTAANIGRQAFWPADVGQNKAVTLVQRANLALGLDWVAVPRAFSPATGALADFDLILTAVDRAAVRAAIGRLAHIRTYGGDPPIWWLDAGNAEHEAQIVFGCWRAARNATWIPNVFDLYPELVSIDDSRQRAPSCSAAESLARQWLPINRIVADIAQNLLWMLFRRGRLDIHGALVDLATLRVSPLRADPQVWAGFGWTARSVRRRGSMPDATGVAN